VGVAAPTRLQNIRVFEMILVRWLAIAAFVAIAFKRKSLTTWILVAMVAGGEDGPDWPAAAGQFWVLGVDFFQFIHTDHCAVTLFYPRCGYSRPFQFASGRADGRQSARLF